MLSRVAVLRVGAWHVTTAPTVEVASADAAIPDSAGLTREVLETVELAWELPPGAQASFTLPIDPTPADRPRTR